MGQFPRPAAGTTLSWLPKCIVLFPKCSLFKGTLKQFSSSKTKIQNDTHTKTQLTKPCILYVVLCVSY